MVEVKKFWESKTFWANVLILAGAVFTDMANVLGTAGTLSVVAVVNIVLRAVTKNPVALKF